MANRMLLSGCAAKPAPQVVTLSERGQRRCSRIDSSVPAGLSLSPFAIRAHFFEKIYPGRIGCVLLARCPTEPPKGYRNGIDPIPLPRFFQEFPKKPPKEKGTDASAPFRFRPRASTTIDFILGMLLSDSMPEGRGVLSLPKPNEGQFMPPF